MKYFWIQALLIVGVGLLAVMFVRRWETSKTRAWKRIAFFAFALVNMYAVVRPGDVTWVANRLGVGRGTDLVLYALVLAVGFLAINTLLHFRALDQKITELARSLAIYEGVKLNTERLGVEVGAVKEHEEA
jgi:hypothetical protein